MKRSIICILGLFLCLGCAYGQSEDIVLKLKVADCFKYPIDSSEAYWYNYFPYPSGDGYSGILTSFAVDEKEWIHLPQIIQLPQLCFDALLPSAYLCGLRIQVFDNDGLIRKIIHIALPDSIQIDSLHFEKIQWDNTIDDILISDDGFYYVRCMVTTGLYAFNVIIKISPDGEIERIWGPLGDQWKTYLESYWEYKKKGYYLADLWFAKDGNIVGGSLIFNRNGNLLRKDDNYFLHIKSNQTTVQSIGGVTYSLDYSDQTISEFIDKNGKSNLYNVNHTFVLDNPFQIIDNGTLIIYRIKKSRDTHKYETIVGKPGQLLVWRDEKGEIDRYVYIIKDKYLPQ